MDRSELESLVGNAIDAALNRPRVADELEGRTTHVHEELTRATSHDFRAGNGPESRSGGFPGMRGRPAHTHGISLITGDE